MTWFYLSLMSIFALAVAELSQQYVLNAKNKIDESVSGSLTFLIQALFTIPILLITGLSTQVFTIFHLDIVLPVLFTNFVASIAMIFYLRSFKVKNISLSSILVSFSVVVSTSIGIVFFHETFTSTKIAGIVIVILAIVGVNYKNLNLEKNHRWGLLAGLMFGLTYSLDKFIVNRIEPFVYIFWGFIFVSLFGFVLNPKKLISAFKESKLYDYLPIVVSGVGYFIYNICTFYAYRLGGEVGRIDAINNSQIFLIILFEYFILKQSQGTFKKILMAVLAFTGVYILGNF